MQLSAAAAGWQCPLDGLDEERLISNPEHLDRVESAEKPQFCAAGETLCSAARNSEISWAA
jgi:hypothetical protein